MTIGWSTALHSSSSLLDPTLSLLCSWHIICNIRRRLRDAVREDRQVVLEGGVVRRWDNHACSGGEKEGENVVEEGGGACADKNVGFGDGERGGEEVGEEGGG